MTSVTARQLFAPSPDASAPSRPPRARDLGPGALLRMLLAFYRDPLAWFGMVGTLLVVAYGGGAVLFVLHADVLGELGPSISPWAHWALDSTLGLVGFAPVVAVLVPLSAWAVTGTPDAAVRPRSYAILAGVLMTLAAAPGPIVHDLLVGRGTWLADRVTTLLGGAAAQVHVHGDGVSQPASIAGQIIVGVPTYILLMWVSLTAIRFAVLLRETARLDQVRAAAAQAVVVAADGRLSALTEPAPAPDLRAAE